MSINNPESGVALASASRTAAATAKRIVTKGASKFVAYINMTAIGTAPSTTVTINARSASGDLYPLLTSAALVAVGKTVLQIGDRLTAVANQVANSAVPAEIVITVAEGNANAHTYNIDYDLIP